MIVTSHMAFECAEKVRRHMREGWELLGGVAIDNGVYAQAMVRHLVVRKILRKYLIDNCMH